MTAFACLRRKLTLSLSRRSNRGEVSFPRPILRVPKLKNSNHDFLRSGLLKMKNQTDDDVFELVKEKRNFDRPVRENFICGACGQQGHNSAEVGTYPKRRRGGEVALSNILETIVDGLRDKRALSHLFLKPVTKKEAPDYLDIIDTPMDLSTIRDKVRKMEYRNRREFRRDVWQISVNAHRYNDQINPGIPPLADQLLRFCDHLLQENQKLLDDAETGIEQWS